MAGQDEEWDTANNREADPYSGGKTPEMRPPGSGNVNGLQITGPTPVDPTALAQEKTDQDWLGLIRAAKSAADTYLAAPRSMAATAYRAYRNQHHDKSSYNDARWRGRARYFVPKTRTAVHKGDAAAAAALFSSADIIDVAANNPLDEAHLASAEITKELVAYRLDKKSGKAGIPWFQIATGSHNDAQITGLCMSKQYWERRETVENKLQPVLDVMGQPQMDPVTGGPMTEMRPVPRVTRDRPMIRLFPMEYVLRDPGADWVDQAQESSFIGLLHPMRVGDAIAFMAENKKSTVKWREVDPSVFQRATGTPIEAQAVSDAREGKTSQRAENKINSATRNFDTTWLIEWFVRDEGKEWHFWTAYTHAILSEPSPVEVAYPHLGGERPVVIGTGVIEPHKIDPLSKVQALLPAQQELNDLRNSILDGVKETLRPLTQVRRGSQVDIKALQNRSGDTAIYVQDVERDLSFDRPGEIGPAGHAESAYLASEFDDMAGQVNQGSVMNNRQLNETATGMKLFSANANTIADFDLRVWIETWVEPVLRQIVRLEQYYEDDEVILQIAGQKAKLFEHYGIDQITDDLLDREVTVTVSAGIGNADPEVKLDKFLKAGAAAVQFLGPEVQARAKQDPIIDELFGLAGFKGAAGRFFHEGDSQDPRMTKMKEALGQMQSQVEDQQAERDNKIELERIQSATQIILELLGHQAKMQEAQVAHDQNMETMANTHVHDLHKTQITGAQKSQQIDQGTQAKNQQIELGAKAKMNGAKSPSKGAPAPSSGPAAPSSPSIDPAMVLQIVMSALPTIMPNTALPNPGGGGGMPQMPQMGQGGGGGGQDVIMQLMAQQQQMMQQMQQLMGMVASSHASVGQGLSQLAQAHSAPKVIMRDQNNRAVGVRPMMSPQGAQQ